MTLRSPHWILKIQNWSGMPWGKSKHSPPVSWLPALTWMPLRAFDLVTPGLLRAVCQEHILSTFRMAFTELQFDVKLTLLWKSVMGTFSRSQDKRILCLSQATVYLRGDCESSNKLPLLSLLGSTAKCIAHFSSCRGITSINVGCSPDFLFFFWTVFSHYLNFFIYFYLITSISANHFRHFLKNELEYK